MLINAPNARQFFASLALPSVPSVLYPFVFCGLLGIVWNSTRARWHIWFLKWWSKSLQCSSPEQFSDTSLLVRQIFCVGCMQFMPSATQVASYSNRWPATATRRWALEESSETQAPRSGQNRTSTNNFISTYLCFLCLPADRTARRSILVLPRGFAPGTWLIIIDEQWQSLKINHFLFAWQGHLLEGWPRLHTKGEAAWRTGRTRTMSGTPLSYDMTLIEIGLAGQRHVWQGYLACANCSNLFELERTWKDTGPLPLFGQHVLRMQSWAMSLHPELLPRHVNCSCFSSNSLCKLSISSWPGLIAKFATSRVKWKHIHAETTRNVV